RLGWRFPAGRSPMTSAAAISSMPAPPPGCVGWPWIDVTPVASVSPPADLGWPRISIVTPSFNQGRDLEETIRSVLLQEYPNLEYVVIDGASTDGSVAVIEKYARHLTHWVSEPDDGCAQALNKGLRRASGEIFGFLNSDDVYEPGVLFEAARRFRERPQVEVLSSHGRVIYSE